MHAFDYPGAGGGGFLQVVLKKGVSKDELQARLKSVFSDTDIDGAICAATMGQVIDSLGLGFCYLRLAADPMNTETLRKKYDIPEEKHCVIALTIGNTDTEYFCSVPRKDIPLL